MTIQLKRVYEDPGPSDGCRILVERLWPRGVSKQAASVDVWARGVAPSPALRKWFGHDPEKWQEFRRRYHAELDENGEEVAKLLERAEAGPVTFVFASRETRFNNAVALAEYLERD